MIGLLIIVGFTALLGLVLWLAERHRNESKVAAMSDELTEKEDESSATESKEKEGECCGMHIVCEKDTLVTFTDKAEYYDDEELDRFSGREADAYTDSEIEEWRDILLTLRPEEIAGWARSIRLRRLSMPEPIREELLMIVGEARSKAL